VALATLGLEEVRPCWDKCLKGLYGGEGVKKFVGSNGGKFANQEVRVWGERC